MGKIITLEKTQKYLDVINHRLWVISKHHKTHKNVNLDFKDHKYIRAIYHDESEYLVIIKSTQNGISEYLLTRAISHAIKGMNVFYVLPTFELVKRFVDERFTKSVQNTPYYRGLVRIVKEQQDIKQTDSVRSKDIGDGNIAFVNSGSPVGFTEYPADEIIIDEMDKCDPVNIKMAWERLSHSNYRWQTKISNPTFKNYAIDREYRDTDMMEYHLPCAGGHLINIDWFKHVVREVDQNKYIIRDKEFTWDSLKDIKPICDICNKPINTRDEGKWIPLNPGALKRGYRLTKMFSGTIPMTELMDRFISGLSDDEQMQRFHNADLGRAFTASGVTITREMILDCESDYNTGIEDGIIIAGIDVGKFYNFVIKKILPEGKLKTLYTGKERDTTQLIGILKKYKVKAGVIDGLPETRESRKIAANFNYMFLCYYGNTKKDSIDLQSKIVTVQRTSAIDAVKEALLTNTILYPHNSVNDEEFVGQMTSSVRVFNDKKRNGQQIGAYEWIEDEVIGDHYLHATAYCLIARRLITLLSRGK